MRESAYQAKLISKIHQMFVGCFIIRNDPEQNQGLPDLLILYGDKWAMLEVKISEEAYIQPNQEYYVRLFNDMSFAAFICPENEEEVLRALQSTFGTRR
jgi:hypothetical protein